MGFLVSNAFGGAAALAAFVIGIAFFFVVVFRVAAVAAFIAFIGIAFFFVVAVFLVAAFAAFIAFIGIALFVVAVFLESCPGGSLRGLLA